MTKQISPSITLQSFSCPLCNANAHQTWHRLYANKEENNAPNIWYPQSYKEIEKNNSKSNTPLADDILEYIKRQAQGEIFIDYKSEGKYGARRVPNLFISECYSCEGISLWLHNKLIYPPEPEAEEANSDMPQDIRKDYEEARIIFKYSPRGAAALLRLCVEKLCDFLKAEGKSLDDKIGDLVKKGLNKRIQKALDAVRVIGNEAVHPGQIDLNDNKDIARALFKLVNQIVKEVIIEKREIDEIYDSLPEKKKEGIEKRDAKNIANAQGL